MEILDITLLIVLGIQYFSAALVILFMVSRLGDEYLQIKITEIDDKKGI